MPEGARNLKLTIAVSVASVLVVASALVILSDGRANSLLSESYTPTELAAIEGYTNASTLCVYNKASVLMKWALADAHIKDFDTKRTADTDEYIVYQSRCISASEVPNIKRGDLLTPAFSAYMGMPPHATKWAGPGGITYNPDIAVQISYVCSGYFWSVTCEQAEAPPTVQDIGERFSEFARGFLQGLNITFSADDLPGECLPKTKKIYGDTESVVQQLADGFNTVNPLLIPQAFQKIGLILKAISKAVATCLKEGLNAYKEGIKAVSSIASVLVGNVGEVIKVVVEGAVHIATNFGSITATAQDVATFWQGGDYHGSGRAVGNIVRMIMFGNRTYSQHKTDGLEGDIADMLG